MGAAKACKQCRQAKRKCLRSDTLGPCAQCIKRNIICSNKLKIKKPQQLVPSHKRALTEQGEDQDGLNLPEEIIIELVEHYIDKIHDRPHSIFHLPTLRENVRRGNMNKALLMAICSMGSRFSAHLEIRLLEHQLTAKSKRIVLDNLEDISLESIQTCILIANLYAAHAKPSSEALFFRIAIGMAQIMRLTLFHSGDTLVTCEIKRRVWWTLFMADRWYSSGLGLPRQIEDCERLTDLPMDESTFHALTIDQYSLVDLFGPIQDLNRRIVQEDLEDNEIDRCAFDLSKRLDAWEETLPADVKLNAENLAGHKTRNTGGPFVALHLGFHHYSTLLYFQYLEAKRTSIVSTKQFAERCKRHASSYSALLKFAREEEGFAAVYPTVGHMAIVSSSVLLHTLLFDDEDKIPSTRGKLNANFEALIELEQYWPALKSMINRLVLFQNMCLLSETSHVHTLNKWMIRFLIEHALPLEEKASDAEMATTSDECDIISTRSQRLAEQGRYTTFLSYKDRQA
ncbi:hypothetical protein B0O99DRAFT_681546 [Bisporella sp. PMI_857]|nr:hypothetical protein B0O99DRAFT_681546 [Bisporella sp. PMI_857]